VCTHHALKRAHSLRYMFAFVSKYGGGVMREDSLVELCSTKELIIFPVAVRLPFTFKTILTRVLWIRKLKWIWHFFSQRRGNCQTFFATIFLSLHFSLFYQLYWEADIFKSVFSLLSHKRYFKLKSWGQKNPLQLLHVFNYFGFMTQNPEF
jgi:hypothetical protein